MKANCKYGFYTCSFIGQVSFCNECEDGSNYTWNEYFTLMENIFTFIKADKFFPEYCPGIKSYKHKIRGKNGRGNPVKFSNDEMKEIKKGVKLMCKDLSEFILQ